MSTEKTGDTDGRYSDICGASNNRGEPCSLPAGWGTPGSQGGRCRFHGGASTGPKDTGHLEENDFAEGNAGGGAPKRNTNAQTANGIWSNWRKVYDRLDDERKATVDRLTRDRAEWSKPNTPEMDPDRRERLARELTVMNDILGWVEYDIYAAMMDDAPDDARGPMIQETVEIDGEAYTIDKANPAIDRHGQVLARRRKLREKLQLHPTPE